MENVNVPVTDVMACNILFDCVYVCICICANRLRQILVPSGNVTTIAGNGMAGYADGLGTRAEIWFPWGVAISPDGAHLYFSMQAGFRLRRLDLLTSEVKTIAGRSEGSYSGLGMHAQFGSTFLDQATWGEDGNILFFTDRGSNIIRYLQVEQQYVGELAGANPGGKPGGMKNIAGLCERCLNVLTWICMFFSCLCLCCLCNP